MHWCGEVVSSGSERYRGRIASIQSCDHIGGIGREEAKANADFIADAFNVAHETGLTPRQLAEQRKDFLEALHDLLTRPTDGSARVRARAVVAKAEGGAA